ncbi:Mth938-like domain-containing protein [Thiococcus pfennigii]|jgi:uncharacterized protein|uniref:Mth938-like domain-containing protein n=1 Tax=Thiococcus pfennigii TaxID=1057 RepID=UPI00190434E7|nr:Mth938-like domain-containing protein [Thiococcus pfennigii]MBK1701744.1 hypothetical protein [Thiococcus pfennigii]MBK1732149.1 hypothetical protein [Thiococcus pfennigii]
MRFAEADEADGLLIQGYEPGAIRVAGRVYREGLILSPRRLVPGWGPATAARLAPSDIEALLAFDPQVIVLGTGERQVFPAAALLAAAQARRIGIEVMDTGAACRTYNILVGEGRNVVAGLMMI